MGWRHKLVVGLAMLTLFGGVGVAQPPMLVVSSMWGAPPGWNPLMPTQAWGHGLMYPSLFVYTPIQERWMPYLAEGFRWVDKLTLEITIRPQAKWWDGTPITAHDVKYTWELGKRYVTPWSATWDYLEEVKVVDARTVQFVTSEKKLNYFALITALTQMILPKHRWELLEQKYGAKLIEFRDDNPKEIIGGGPYKLAWWVEDFWVYERVDDWWGRDLFGLPQVPSIGHRVFKDNPAANLAFSRLELDVMTHFTPAVWELWVDQKLPVRTYYSKSPFYISYNTVLLYLNFARPPLDNPVIRRAIAFAVPFEDLIEKAYFGYSVKAHPTMIIHTSPAARWIDANVVAKYGEYEFNLERAKQLLDAAGIVDRDGDGVRELPDGTRLGPWTIEVPFGWTDWMLMCEMIAENLRKLGIAVTAKFPDFAIWEYKVITGDFDMIIRWAAPVGLDHPWNTFRMVMDPRVTGPVGEAYPAGNWHRYMNPDVIPLIDAIPKEIDPGVVSVYYSKLQEIALRDVVGIPLFYGAVWYIFSEKNWVGWPQEEYPERWACPLYFMWWPNPLPVLFGLVPRGQDPAQSPWVTNMLPMVFPTARFFEELAKVG